MSQKRERFKMGMTCNIGMPCKIPNYPLVGKVIDINTSYYGPTKVLVGWKVKHRGKLYLKTKWVLLDKLIAVPKPKPWYLRLCGF